MKNNTTVTVLATAITLSFGAAALADTMSKPQYTSARNEIGASFKAAKVTCDSMKANAKDICLAEAKGKEKVALADLEVGYKPSTKARYEARLARADAEFGVAKEKCDDLAGNAKDVCRKEATTAHTAGKADAKAQMKTVDASAAALKKTTEAKAEASETTARANEQATKAIADAHKDAAADKREAEYALAKEKCDGAAGAAKDACVANAKARYGK